MVFIYAVENAILVKKPKTVAENAQNNTVVMHIFYKKNVVSVWQSSIVFNVKR